MKKYKVEQIDDYQNRLTEQQEIALIKHCNDYDIYPEICAWYDDMKDFYQDWVYDNEIFETKAEAKERYQDGVETGEFKKFSSGEIIRLSI